MEFPLIVMLAFHLASGDADWPKFLQQTEKSYATWQADHTDNTPGDWKRFIDEKVIECSKPRDGKTLKAALFWIALYKQHNQPPSQIVLSVSKELEAQFKGVNWDDLWRKIETAREVQTAAANTEKKGK